MLDFIRSFKKKKTLNKAELIARFNDHPEHQWIINDPTISRLVRILCDSWTTEVYEFLASGNEILIVKAQGQLASAMSSINKTNVVLAYPDLVAILRSASPMRGVAILAHEIGHIVKEHSKRKITNLEAQIEADRVAFEMGFGEDLEQVLIEHEHSIDCRVRIAKLTQYYYSSKNEISE